MVSLVHTSPDGIIEDDHDLRSNTKISMVNVFSRD
jgi:hypothetical protein